ncbi:hypothetical protein [Sulfoacidibacillus thermotolerans]|uniref:Uncharacterized protein n=1 Tax=Sulfoacidibacillus thermotolerans TaxID=1765684 RepID=A0A2U3CU79_SULT2|nr:hypothetical protein [Sulfoacidibacillus thermotolerans]PWI52581.1 hypothetical protein BM613_14060 [Sulfoacidibacillus thermotolerans]
MSESLQKLFVLAEQAAIYAEILEIASALLYDEVLSKEEVAERLLAVAQEISGNFPDARTIFANRHLALAK